MHPTARREAQARLRSPLAQTGRPPGLALGCSPPVTAPLPFRSARAPPSPGPCPVAVFSRNPQNTLGTVTCCSRCTQVTEPSRRQRSQDRSSGPPVAAARGPTRDPGWWDVLPGKGVRGQSCESALLLHTDDPGEALRRARCVHTRHRVPWSEGAWHARPPRGLVFFSLNKQQSHRTAPQSFAGSGSVSTDAT